VAPPVSGRLDRTVRSMAHDCIRLLLLRAAFRAWSRRMLCTMNRNQRAVAHQSLTRQKSSGLPLGGQPLCRKLVSWPEHLFWNWGSGASSMRARSGCSVAALAAVAPDDSCPGSRPMPVAMRCWAMLRHNLDVRQEIQALPCFIFLALSNGLRKGIATFR